MNVLLILFAIVLLICASCTCSFLNGWFGGKSTGTGTANTGTGTGTGTANTGTGTGTANTGTGAGTAITSSTHVTVVPAVVAPITPVPVAPVVAVTPAPVVPVVPVTPVVTVTPTPVVPVVTVTPVVPAPPVCNAAGCNAAMYDWMVNKYWAFGDSSTQFSECSACAKRGFTAPFQVQKNGTWTNYGNKNDAYNAAAF